MPEADFFGAFGLYVHRQFLDEAACGRLRREIAAAPARPALVAESDADAVDEGYRKSVSSRVSEATRSMVQRRLMDLKESLERHFGTELEGCQRAQFLRYREGDYFRAHADHEDEGPRHVTERRVSVVVFLNGESDDPGPDSYSGGALTFFGLMGDPRADSMGLPLQGESGLLVAFPADLVHSVSPVTAGERYTFVSWFF
jgi:SM-20-related protein